MSLYFQDDHLTIKGLDQEIELPGDVPSRGSLSKYVFQGISPNATAFKLLEKVLKTMNLDRSISVDNFAQFLLFLPGVSAITIDTYAQRERFFYEEDAITVKSGYIF
jgi:hypothetical protein